MDAYVRVLQMYFEYLGSSSSSIMRTMKALCDSIVIVALFVTKYLFRFVIIVYYL